MNLILESVTNVQSCEKEILHTGVNILALTHYPKLPNVSYPHFCKCCCNCCTWTQISKLNEEGTIFLFKIKAKWANKPNSHKNKYYSWMVSIGFAYSFVTLNAKFNNISVLSWRSVLLVEETGIPGENHRHVAIHWQNFITRYYTPRPGWDSNSEHQCIGRCTFNFHTITITTSWMVSTFCNVK